MKDYRVKVMVKNNKLLSAIEELGYTSAIKFSKDVGVTPGIVYDLLNLKVNPLNSKTKELKPGAKLICEFLGKDLEDIYPIDNIDNPLSTNQIMVEMDKPEMGYLLSNTDSNPLKLLEDKEELENVIECLNLLDKRNSDCIKLRFGLSGDKPLTLRELGEVIPRECFVKGTGAMTGQRMRELLAVSLRKLRFLLHKRKQLNN
jgi:DNA-directed RNA polymerase sigma subunit (sigma70/sigma32)